MCYIYAIFGIWVCAVAPHYNIPMETTISYAILLGFLTIASAITNK